MPYKDPAKLREARRKRYRANPEASRARKRKWREDNREYDLQRKREYDAANHEAKLARCKKYYYANIEAERAKHGPRRLRKFGLDPYVYTAMLVLQHWSCRACKSPSSRRKGGTFAIDHCHDTEKVRGLLCSPCNLAAGMGGDTYGAVKEWGLGLLRHLDTPGFIVERRPKPKGLKGSDLDRYHKYGLLPDDYARLLSQQDGKCNACRKIPTKTLAVDHCHTTQRLRGLLCSPCNTGQGLLGDSFTEVKRRLDGLLKHLASAEGQEHDSLFQADVSVTLERMVVGLTPLSL